MTGDEKHGGTKDDRGHVAHDHAHDYAHGPMQDHDHDHVHDHDHSHGHSHGLHHHSTFSNLKLALILNLGFSVVEIGGGLWTGSVAVLSNAIHDLSDALAVGVAYIMERLGTRQASPTFSYGYRRLSLLSALGTCAFLVTACIVVVARAIPRLAHPETPRLGGMAVFAVLGVLVNGFAALRLARGATMNERVVSWHMLEDVLSWATVLIGSLVMQVADLPIIDPILCLLSSLFILWGVLRSLKRTLKLFLQAAPDGIDLPQLSQEIGAIPGIVSIHDTHFWSLDGESHVLTLHVVAAAHLGVREHEALKRQIRTLVARRGRIHVTVEIEADGDHCPDAECVPLS